jgi:hypothetical protein
MLRPIQELTGPENFVLLSHLVMTGRKAAKAGRVRTQRSTRSFPPTDRPQHVYQEHPAVEDGTALPRDGQRDVRDTVGQRSAPTRRLVKVVILPHYNI